jgi:hypothetical protein
MRAWWYSLAVVVAGGLWGSTASATGTAQDVMRQVQRQLSAASEMALGEMRTYVYEQLHRHYAFVLARSWHPATRTEQVRIDFESPANVPDAEASMRAQNRYLLKRVGQLPPTQWLYLPSLRRTRIIPYHPAERLLQSQCWFYDLTTITDLDDFAYQFVEPTPEAPVIDGTPQGEVTPYVRVRFRLRRQGDTYLVTALTFVAEDTTREAEYSGYEEIAPGWFRPRRLVIRGGDSQRTEMTFAHWHLNAAAPALFSVAALETKALVLPTADGPE